MNGGLMKTTSRFAIAAAASVFATSAMAADLGGNCCADLEERIAELESTTVRKGNRKVSLQLSGQVHESIMFWDDGSEKNVYTGVNHVHSSSQFRFLGDVKIDPNWTAGYLMEMETQGKSDSNDMNQLDQNNSSGTGVVVRHNTWWIDNKRLGRVWLGLTTPAGGGIDGINLSNSNIASNPKIGLVNSSFRLRGANGNLGASTSTWSTVLGGNNGLVSLSDETRHNVIKYVSPTVMGFIFSTTWGEDDMWDVALRYAGEFSGFKVALGGAYTQVTDANIGGAGTVGAAASAASNHFGGCADLANNSTPAGAAIITSDKDRDCSSWVVGGSVMHVATGLFAAGSYGERDDELRKQLAEARITNGNTENISSTDRFWQIRGGIEQKWFGIGKTTLFGEGHEFKGTPLGGGAAGANNGNFTAADNNINSFAGIIGKSTVTAWGLGAVQTIDAAAMDLYLTYRNYSVGLDVVETAGGDKSSHDALKDMQVITFGGRIQF